MRLGRTSRTIHLPLSLSLSLSLSLVCSFSSYLSSCFFWGSLCLPIAMSCNKRASLPQMTMMIIINISSLYVCLSMCVSVCIYCLFTTASKFSTTNCCCCLLCCCCCCAFVSLLHESCQQSHSLVSICVSVCVSVGGCGLSRVG